MKQGVKKVLLALSCVVIFAGLIFVVLYFPRKNLGQSNTASTSAQDTSTVLSSQAEWDAGTKVNIDSSGGQMEINDPSPSTTDLTGKTITVSHDEARKGNVVDGNTGTGWGVESPGSEIAAGDFWWKIDLGELIVINKFSLYEGCFYPLGGSIKYSTNDVDYSVAVDTLNCADPGWNDNSIDGGGTINARYVKIENKGSIGGAEVAGLIELRAYSSGTATHTSAATQITNANLYQWQTFTPTYTEPANTTVSFRLRTSTDANTWTSWTAYQTPNSAEALDISSLVTSKTGDAGSETFYKYIQVETKLTSSDGVSTPTIDSYSIGYHTNVVPSKPTGATATAGN